MQKPSTIRHHPQGQDVDRDTKPKHSCNSEHGIEAQIEPVYFISPGFNCLRPVSQHELGHLGCNTEYDHSPEECCGVPPSSSLEVVLVHSEITRLSVQLVFSNV